MLSSQHAIVGGSVGLATGNPFLGFLVGMASHHVLDMLPHVDGIPERNESRRFSSRNGDWPKSEYIIAYADSFITLVILLFVSWHLNDSGKILNFFAGAVGGVFPDLMDNVPFWKKRFRATKFGEWYHRSVHKKLHFHWHDAHVYKLILAVLLQILITIGGIWFSLRNF